MLNLFAMIHQALTPAASRDRIAQIPMDWHLQSITQRAAPRSL